MRCVVSTVQLLALSCAAAVQVVRTPDGGIQPQGTVDASGVAHVIYYKGDPAGGDLYYIRDAGQGFNTPVKVNQRAGSAIAMGSIRGAQLAVGRSNRVHVVWNGGKGAGKALIGGKEQTPLFYARLNDAGTVFEPERNIPTEVGGLDGGSSVAADRNGNVYVFWHGSPPGNKRGEVGRALVMARSSDDGRTFSPEKPVLEDATGACGCCGMRAFADARGAVYVTFRAAGEGIHRDEVFAMAPRAGVPFQILHRSRWRAATCPMSSTTLTPAPAGALAAWETDGQVFYSAINGATGTFGEPVSPPGNTKRKHPVAVRNSNGEVLLAWTEGTGWAKGGTLHWQLFDRDGKPTSEPGKRDSFPVWSLPTAYVNAAGEFVVMY